MPTSIPDNLLFFRFNSLFGLVRCYFLGNQIKQFLAWYYGYNNASMNDHLQIVSEIQLDNLV